MLKKNKGKILRIKPGYNPNCSGGMYVLMFLIYGGPIILILTAISAIIAKRLYNKHISESETYEKGAI